LRRAAGEGVRRISGPRAAGEGVRCPRVDEVGGDRWGAVENNNETGEIVASVGPYKQATRMNMGSRAALTDN
jgi:hypothetical protein